MMLYAWLKFVHVISSTILFGTGIGTACSMLYANYTKDINVISATTRYVVLADWIFTGISGFVQPLTGFWMVYLVGYSLNSFWLIGSMIGYLIAAFCWFPVVYLQLKMKEFSAKAKLNKTSLPDEYYRYFNYWLCLGFPAFFSLVVVFYLMTNKPSL